MWLYTAKFWGRCLGAVLVLSGVSAWAQPALPVGGAMGQRVADAALAALPESASLVLADATGRVVRFDLAPGERLPQHAGDTRVVVSLTDARIGWTDGDAAETVVEWSAGDVHTHAPGLHALRNLGAEPMAFLVILRGAAPAAADDADLASERPDLATVVLQERGAKVVRVDLPPGASTGVHGGNARIVVSLVDYRLRWTEGDAPAEDRDWSAGEVHVHGAGQHEAANVGDSMASFLLVSWLPEGD